MAEDKETIAGAAPAEDGAPATAETRIVTEQVVRIQNPFKSAAESAKGRWSDFLDTSYDGSIVWALRRACQWIAVFFRSVKALATGGRGE